MTWPITFERAHFKLSSERVTASDSERQIRTAEEIFRRLAFQPGLVLADEVGMGKTFVALVAAFAAALNDKGRRPVVIMVPTSVLAKWQRDFDYFSRTCVEQSLVKELKLGVASNALEFFRLLDDPVRRRKRVILLAHGSFHRNLRDPWAKLAILKFAMHHAKLGDRRKSLTKFAATILETKSSFSNPELFEQLLKNGFEKWREIINEFGGELDDDPVPESLHKALDRSEMDLEPLRDALLELPLRESLHIKARLTTVRRLLNTAFQESWKHALRNARFRSPLLILDEAHHLKNPATKLASLFVAEEGESESSTLSGALAGGFERMLFLTATPFQLGHGELLNVVERFDGIDWKSVQQAGSSEAFALQRAALSSALDEAQQASLDLDSRWGQLRHSDLDLESNPTTDHLEAWWSSVLTDSENKSERVQQVMRAYQRTRDAVRAAEVLLQPWVIRHLRSRVIGDTKLQRRLRLVGDSVRTNSLTDVGGLPIIDDAMLPFLLAARAQAMVAHVSRRDADRSVRRATFADGLASSYETFLETSRVNAPSTDEADADEFTDETISHVPSTGDVQDPRLRRYLQRLRDSLPSEEAFANHPKISAVVDRVVTLWEAGEKVVVFCHFRVTGRALLKHLSAGMSNRLWTSAAHRLGEPPEALRERARQWSDAFDVGRPLERTLRGAVNATSSSIADMNAEEQDRVADVVRRFVRTPLFLARYVDLTDDDRERALGAALSGENGGLAARLNEFGTMLVGLNDSERRHYLDALEKIHPGPQYEAHSDSERSQGSELLPNIRLVNGSVTPERRERLLLGFNSPFFPEVLVASSVMSEGVDLHLNCRHVIHHDLDWNPSTLEQRTGRVDRINCKADQVGRSIEVAIPYVGGTQDEKMYRVVMDRERWFQVVMGESFKTDEHSTDRIAERVPLPAAVALELSMRLEVKVRETVAVHAAPTLAEAVEIDALIAHINTLELIEGSSGPAHGIGGTPLREGDLIEAWLNHENDWVRGEYQPSTSDGAFDGRLAMLLTEHTGVRPIFIGYKVRRVED